MYLILLILSLNHLFCYDRTLFFCDYYFDRIKIKNNIYVCIALKQNCFKLKTLLRNGNRNLISFKHLKRIHVCKSIAKLPTQNPSARLINFSKSKNDHTENPNPSTYRQLIHRFGARTIQLKKIDISIALASRSSFPLSEPRRPSSSSSCAHDEW